MSYRELRNFTEMMRSLGYHRPVGMENFRTPNFELVADLMDWLLHRYDPTVQIPDDISTESQRVKFVTLVVDQLTLKTGIRINARKLYGADGYAVQELLKIATMLYDAQKVVTYGKSVGSGGDSALADEDGSGGLGLNKHQVSSKLHDLKSTRSLCSSIVESGAALHELLSREEENRAERKRVMTFIDGLSRNLDSNSEQETVERSVNMLLNSHSEKLTTLKTQTEELQKDESNLETKIKKKKQELDRCQNRLGQLNSVRPAFMDEYEKLEEELAKVYESYVGRFRNLDYLENELDTLNREEQEKIEENNRALKRMQKKLREEEWRMLRGEDGAGGGAGGAFQAPTMWAPGAAPGGNGGSFGGPRPESNSNRAGRPGSNQNQKQMGRGDMGPASSGRPGPGGSEVGVVGSMVAISDDSDSSDVEIGDDSDSDIEVGGGGNKGRGGRGEEESSEGSADIQEGEGSDEDDDEAISDDDEPIEMSGRGGNDHNF